jgi:hypothetical protein
MENIHSYNASRWLVAAARGAAGSAVLAMALCAGGCTALAALIAGFAPDPMDPPSYTGLAHQTCGILVLTDPGTRIDLPLLELDVARSLEEKLKVAIGAKTKEVEGLTLVNSASVSDVMRNHPELEAEPITAIAARLPLTRLIYIDVDDFSTRSRETLYLYRGSMTAKVSVLEIKDGKATVAFTTDPIQVIYPPGSTEEGAPNLDETKLYTQTIDAFTTKAAELFLPHPPPSESQP